MMEFPKLPETQIWVSTDPPLNSEQKKSLEIALSILGPHRQFRSLYLDETEIKYINLNGSFSKLSKFKKHIINRLPKIGFQLQKWSIYIDSMRYKYSLNLEEEFRKNNKAEVWTAFRFKFNQILKSSQSIRNQINKLTKFEYHWLGGVFPGGIEDFLNMLERIDYMSEKAIKYNGKRKRDLITEYAGFPDERLVSTLRAKWEYELGRQRPSWSGDFKKLVESVANIAGVKGRSLSARQARVVLSIETGSKMPLSLDTDAGDPKILFRHAPYM